MQGLHRLIRTERLDLVSMSPELMAALRDGDWQAAGEAAGLLLPDEWREEDWSWLRRRPEETLERPLLVDWLPHLVVARDDHGAGRVVGEVGFHGPPSEGEAEFGYMVVVAERRKGYATEAAGGLIEWARRRARLPSARASVDPSNIASIGVLRKLGFQAVGSYLHADRGEQLLFRRRLN